ncbi:MAG TPA: hypothetical protein VF092_19965 [Longimicrobium sp.]
MSDLYDAIEALDLEDDETFFFEDDEADDEARRNGRTGVRFRRNVKTGRGGGYYRPRPPAGSTKYVTQPQLQAALARVSADVKANSEGIKTVNARVNTLSSEQAAQGTALRKEVAERKKEGTQLKNETKKARDFAVLQLLLTKPPKVFAADGVTELKVVDQNDFLLPLVLLGGLGGGGDSGGGLGGDNSLLFLLLLTKK